MPDFPFARCAPHTGHFSFKGSGVWLHIARVFREGCVGPPFYTSLRKKPPLYLATRSLPRGYSAIRLHVDMI
ncbi:hypothetical protein EB008_01550 [bacterium]|nr:hypothetical protein [bacterium]